MDIHSIENWFQNPTLLSHPLAHQSTLGGPFLGKGPYRLRTFECNLGPRVEPEPLNGWWAPDPNYENWLLVELYLFITFRKNTSDKGYFWFIYFSSLKKTFRSCIYIFVIMTLKYQSVYVFLWAMKIIIHKYW